MSRRKSNWDRLAEIDASRENTKGPKASFVKVTMTRPVTCNNLAYPETAAIQVEVGQWPEWFKPFVPRIRRIQTSPNQNFGFVTDTYSCFSLDTYVPASDPANGADLYRQIMKAATEAGWIVREWAPGRQFEAWERRLTESA